MRNSRYNTLPQLAAALAGFALTILPLESEGLLLWARRLEVTQAANVAVQVAGALHRALAPLHLEWIRREGLADLDRLGWGDDPARLQAARIPSTSAASRPAQPCASAIAGASQPIAAHPVATLPLQPLLPLSSSAPVSTPLTPLAPPANAQPRVVALAGDSMMAVGLSNILLRATAADRNLRVLKAFRSGTGLARPDVFDWMQEYPAMIGSERPDAVIVAIGANDGQGFLENGKVLAFGTDGWVQAYQNRIRAFLNLLTQDGARVVWIGLPPMKSPQFNEKAALINRVAYSVVSRNPRATWWNPQPYIGDDTGRFREFQTTPNGQTTRLRAPDGIHLSDEGAMLLSPSLLEWLNAPPATVTAKTLPEEDPKAATGRALRKKKSHTPGV